MSALALTQVRQIIDAALLAADEPLTVDRLHKLFGSDELDADDPRGQLREALQELEAAAEGRGYELKRVASGYRYQVRQELSPWVSRLWEEKPPRYTRALLETLALIAYRQPATRGDIEQVRGVTVSPNIMRTLVERGWIRVVGQRDVPGRPAMYGTTRAFLDYFNLKSLDELPPLNEIQALLDPVLVEEAEVADAAAQADAEAQGETAARADTEDDAAAEAAEASAEAPAESAEPADDDAGGRAVSAEVVVLPTATRPASDS